MNLFEQARKLADEAERVNQQQEIERQAAKAAFHEEQRRYVEAWAQQAWAQQALVKCRDGIISAAKQGKRRLDYSIAQFEDCVYEQTKFRAAALARLLKAEGFTVKENVDVNEPCGSDSYFPNKVYSTVVSVSW